MGGIISIEKLEVLFGNEFQLSISNIELAPDDAVAVIGPNGSGKTTMMSAIVGLTHANTARGALLGVNLRDWPKQHAIRHQIGVQLQTLQQHPGLYVGELVRLHQAIYPKSSAHLLQLLGINELCRRRYGALSQGQRRRVDIFLAMAHGPRLLILDEPTADLDDRYRSAMRSLISARAVAVNGAILFATHLVDDLQIANRIMWLRAGRIMAVGGLSELIATHLGPFKGVLDFTNPSAATEFRKRGLDRIVMSAFPQGESRLVLFGAESMHDPFHTYAMREDVRGYSYGPTSAADFLGYTNGSFECA